MGLLDTVIENIQYKALGKRPPRLLIVNRATYNRLRMEAWQMCANREDLSDRVMGVKIRVLDEGEYILV